MWTESKTQRGSTLLVTMILLTVLTVLGTAAVSLASRDRINASSQARYQRLVQCASAAQAMIWAELARYGGNYLGSSLPVGQVTLPDGTRLAAPIHYDQDAATGTAAVAYSVVSGGGGPPVADMDCTNKICGQTNRGNPVNVVARCTDPHGRQFEVEMSFALAL